MPEFKVQRTFVFTKNAAGKRYIEAVNEGDRGFVAKWHTAQPSGIIFVTVEAVSRGDLKKLEKQAFKMGSHGTTSEQAVPTTTPAQAKVDVARKERENARREAEQKDRQQRQDQEKQAATRKQQATDREAKRETERQTQDKEQSARAKRDAQIQKDDERRRAELARSADQREREQEAEPDEAGIEKTVATAVEKGVKAAMGKKDEKKEKKEGVLSFGEFIDEQPANFAGQGTEIAGLGGDEPIVRRYARRKKDCSKVKGPCVPLPVETPIFRRSARVAESVMRQLKAASIAGDVVNEAVQRCKQCGKKFSSNAAFNKHVDKCAGVPKREPGESEKAYTARLLKAYKKSKGLQEAYIAKKKENLDIFGYRFIIVFEAQDDIGAMLPGAKNRRGRQAKKILTGLISGGDLKKEILARLKKNPRIEVLTDRKMRPRTISDAYYVDVQPAKEGERFKNEKEARDVLKKALSGLKVRGLTEDVEAPEVPVEPTQPTTFAGSPIFKVDPETYAKCCKGRAKWARWSKTLNLEDEGHQAIRTFASRNPKRPIVVQCSETGDMKFLRFNRTGGGGNRRKRKTALPPVDIQLDIEQTEAVDPKELEKIGVKSRIRAFGPDRVWPVERSEGLYAVVVKFRRADFTNSKLISDFKKEVKKSGWKAGTNAQKREITVLIPAKTPKEAAAKGDMLVTQAVTLDRRRQLKGKK